MPRAVASSSALSAGPTPSGRSSAAVDLCGEGVEPDAPDRAAERSPSWRSASHVPTIASTARPTRSSPTRPTTSPSSVVVEVGAEEHLVAVDRRPADADLGPASPMSATWCWAHEFGQPDTDTRSAGLRRSDRAVEQVAPGAGAVVMPSAHTGGPGARPDLGVATLAEQEQAALAEARADRAPTSGDRDVAQRTFWSRVSVRMPSPWRSARSQNSAISERA